MSGPDDPTPRQVLYALVSAGFWLVVLVLVVGAAVTGAVPVWWTAVMGLALAASGAWGALNWRRTGPILLIGIGLLAVWVIGSLATG